MIRTDADSDLTNSLDHCLLTLTLAWGDPRNCKWCVIAAYSAAQTAMGMVLEAQGDWKHFKPEDRGKPGRSSTSWRRTRTTRATYASDMRPEPTPASRAMPASGPLTRPGAQG